MLTYWSPKDVRDGSRHGDLLKSEVERPVRRSELHEAKAPVSIKGAEYSGGGLLLRLFARQKPYWSCP